MAPPAAVIIVVSVATTAVVAYAVKEAWEPHIKPELLKARHAARMWWNNRRLLTPVQINTLGSKRKEGKRSQSPDVPDESHDQGDARLEMLVNSALELPTETHDGIRLRQRSAANRNGAATPNEIVVEMDELDKTNPWMLQAPITPTTRGSAPELISMSSAASSFVDTHDPSDDYSAGPFTLSPHHIGRNNELQLSFPGLTSNLPPSRALNARPNIRPESPASFRGAGPHPNLNATDGASLSQRARLDRVSSPASTFSWADITSTSPVVGERRSAPFSASAGDDFIHLHHDDADRSEQFSIGSYDDLTGSSSHGVGETVQSDRSDAGSAADDDDEPTSPPHHSEQGSPRMKSPSSSSEWESVGSPSSDGRRLV